MRPRSRSPRPRPTATASTSGPRTLDLRSPDGHFRQVVAQPIPEADETAWGTAPVDRPSGWLGDLGAPDVFYLNVAYEVTPDSPTALAAIQEAQGASAMVVDCRGYPQVDYDTFTALIPAGFALPEGGFPFALAPGQGRLLEAGPFSAVFPPASGPPTFTGPLVLLVGTDTVSAGEYFATIFVDNQRPVHVVGRPTAGTNGAITGLELPGHYSFSFTGEDIHHADGSLFIGVGITPDIPVTLTQSNVSGGNDPELAAALAALGL